MQIDRKKSFKLNLFDGYKIDGVCSVNKPVRLTALIYEPRHDKVNKVTAPSENSDQPGHPPSLIRVIAVRLMGS